MILFVFLRRPVAWLALGLLALTGCMHPGLNDAARVGPFFSPTNFTGDPALPPGLRRVLLLPLHAGPRVAADSMAALDPVFALALQQTNRFEIVALTREECMRRFGAESLGSTTALPERLLERVRHEFAADAVMFVDVPVFRAYQPLALGIRAKLVEARSGRAVWAFDEAFAAADPAVANSARHHFIDRNPQGIPADLTRAALQSPAQFAAYAASAAFATLPPVPPPQPAR